MSSRLVVGGGKQPPSNFQRVYLARVKPVHTTLLCDGAPKVHPDLSQVSLLQTCMPSSVQVMGCCWGVPDPPEVAFDPVIGLSDKLKAGGVQVQGNEVSGHGSILGDSPVLQDKAYFEVTIVHPGTFAVGLATKETPLDSVMSQALATATLTPYPPAMSACRPSASAAVRVTGQGGDSVDADQQSAGARAGAGRGCDRRRTRPGRLPRAGLLLPRR